MQKLCNKLGVGMSLTSKENIGTKVNIIFPKGKFTDFKVNLNKLYLKYLNNIFVMLFRYFFINNK